MKQKKLKKTFRSEGIISSKKAGKKLSDKQIRDIPMLLIKGYTIRNIAKEFGVPTYKVARCFETQYKGNTFPINISGKHEPYFEDEDDYGKIPSYKFNSVSDDEKKIYNEI